MKDYGKRVLSSLLSIIMLCVIISPGILIAASAKTQKVLVDFEKYKLSYPQTSYKGVSLTKDAYDGKKALSVKFSNSTGFEDKHFILSEKKDAVELENDSIYSVSFYYKISDSSPCNFDFDFYVTLKDSPLAAKYRKTVSENAAVITTNTEADKWIKYETELVLYGGIPEVKGKKCNALALGITPSKSNSALEIVIDNISVEYKGVAEPCVINFDSMGGNTVNSIESYKGAKINWPFAPKKDGYTFVGWYTDAACKTLYKENYYKSENITLYAKWVETDDDCILINYDEDGYGTKKYTWVDDPCGGITSDYYTSQGQALRYYEVPTTGISRHVHQSDKDVELSNNTVYRITFEYKILSGLGGVQFYAFNPQDGTDVYKYSKSTLTQNKDWVTATYYFNTEFYEDNTYKLGISPYSTISTNPIDVVFDNLKIEKVETTDESVIIFNNNDGLNASYITGKKGTKLELPATPQRDGYVFLGWYENLESQTEFTDTTFDISKNVLGRWSKEVTEQDFETYNAYGRAEGYDMDYEIYRKGVTPNFNSNNVHSGNTSIHRIGAYKGIKSVSVFDSSMTPLSTNETYIFSFWVKLESCNNADDAIYFTNTKSLLYGWLFDDKYEPVVTYGELLDGKWHKISFAKKTLLPFAAIYTTGDASLYIDDFSATWVPQGTVLDSSKRVGPGEGEGKTVVVGNHSAAESLAYLEKYLSFNTKTTNSNTGNSGNSNSGYIISDTNNSGNGLNNGSNGNDGADDSSESTSTIKKIIKKIIKKPGEASQLNIPLIVGIASGACVLAGLGGFFAFKFIKKRRSEGLEKKS